jgi:hypothetical protein
VARLVGKSENKPTELEAAGAYARLSGLRMSVALPPQRAPGPPNPTVAIGAIVTAKGAITAGRDQPGI